MCLNCGCGLYDDDMGNKDNIIRKTLAKAAIASGMNGENTIEELKKALERIKPEDIDKIIEELKKA